MVSPQETGGARGLGLLVLALVTLALGIASGCGDDEIPVGAPRSTLLDDSSTVTYRQSEPGTATDPALPVVVFLHGASFDSSVWERTGLLDDVAATGHRAVALDLPGKGGTDGVGGGDWLAAALDGLGVERAVLVAPSASGPMAFELLEDHPDRVAGFVPVSPVGGGDFRWPGGEAPPTAVVLGEGDDGFATSTRALAEEIPGATLVVIPDAGHAAYADQPKRFMAALGDLLRRADA